MGKENIKQVPPPFLVSYSITSTCNLSCKYCYSESSPEAGGDDLTTDELLRVIDELAGCRGRAYVASDDMLAADPGCWIRSPA